MPEKFEDKTIFSLVEVARSIQKTISDRYKSVYWVKAEMNKLNHYTHSGHCYPELVEKKDGKVIAEMRSILWKTDYQRINQCFIEVVKEPLRNGITILFQATISYDPLYGMSLRIVDIDPAYVLGELEREKVESLRRLKAENLYDSNKKLAFPLLPKRIAVISVETSKGYADFLNVIERNPWGYRFEYTLFTALLQGDRSVPSIINQLKRIAGNTDDFDVVAIIRGGGGEDGLSSYNHYDLAATIAQFPIPVLTGIGHSTNETVSEMVAYRNAITPTELADFLIQRFHEFAVPVQQAQELIANKSQRLLEESKLDLTRTLQYFSAASLALLQRNQHLVATSIQRLHMTSSAMLMQDTYILSGQCQILDARSRDCIRERHSELSLLANTVRVLDPQNVLKRGYSITIHQGKVVKDIQQLAIGAEVETTIAGGTFTSVVNKIKIENHE